MKKGREETGRLDDRATKRWDDGKTGRRNDQMRGRGLRIED